MLTGRCHCGQLTWTFDGEAESATACNCTLCRRYGVLWLYGHENEDIRVTGDTRAYAWGPKSTAFHFCPACGCVGFWRCLTTTSAGRRRMAVNVRLAEPSAVAQLPIEPFDGLHTMEDLPRDGRSVRDLWC